MQIVTPSAENLVVGISDAKLSADPSATVVTYALGSCLGLAVYDPMARVGGIMHCLLPLSAGYADKAKANPFMFVDTGVPVFLNQFFDMGGDSSRMIVKVSGCGNMQDASGQFNIGQRNYTVLRKILWKNNILISGELISGTDPKTMSLTLHNGKVVVRIDGVLVEI